MRPYFCHHQNRQTCNQNFAPHRVVAHIRSQTTLRWRPKGSGILPKRTSALREVDLTSRVLDDVGGYAEGGVDRRSCKPRNNFYKRSLAYWFLHAYLYYGILKRTRFIDT